MPLPVLLERRTNPMPKPLKRTHTWKNRPARALPSTNTRILTINGGSSGIKFALFDATKDFKRLIEGRIEGIGLPNARFSTRGSTPDHELTQPIFAKDYATAVKILMEWIEQRFRQGELTAVGHRVVHGGPKFSEPQPLTTSIIAELRKLSPFDPEHLPEEILLAEAFQQRFPDLPQIACFDTAFHHDLPRVARLLPIPRRFEAKGIRRYGFHGLSCQYLMGELARLDGAKAAQGRVILAHLGNGASVTAVHHGRSIDTSMSFTPTSGLPMGTRSGDLDPSLATYLGSEDQMTAKQFRHMINRESGLLGISETTSDMAELLKLEKQDSRAAEAIDLFCYQTKKWIGAFAAALGGLDTLVFAGGIGENAPQIRSRICKGLDYLGLHLDGERNAASAPTISSNDSPVNSRVIPTDEEWIIAQTVCQVLEIKTESESIK